MKDSSYFHIFGWMITQLGLTDNADLLIFAYLYQFTNGGTQWYGGGFDGLGYTPEEVNASLERLLKKMLICKDKKRGYRVCLKAHIATKDKAEH